MGFLSGLEARASLENPSVPLSDPSALAILFGESFKSGTGVKVTTESALGVPAVWAAVNFLAKTMASLPLKLYRDGDERKALKGDPLYTMLHDVVNEDRLTSFKWRMLQMTTCLTNGRAFTYIERNRAQRPANLWPLDPANVTIEKRTSGGVVRTFYEVKDGNRRIPYDASEILDFPFILAADEISHYSPIKSLKDAIGLAISLEAYAGRIFQSGGVPPLTLQGPQMSSGAVRRAKAAIDSAVKEANREGENILYMPEGHRLEALGFNPEQTQLVMARLFQLQEIGRIYGLPPMFLQDLSHGTFSNTEQQDLHLIKHTLTHWLELWEQELNAKLFSVGRRDRFVEFDLDGIQRGAFKDRMDAAARAVMSGLRTPDEMRAKDNLPSKPGGDRLYIQGATVPLEMAGEINKPTPDSDGGGSLEGEDNGE